MSKSLAVDYLQRARQHRMRRRSLCRCAAAAAIAVCLAPATAQLDATSLRRLIVMDDREVAPILAAEVAWMGETLVAAGWEHWPHSPVIIAHGPTVAAPLFPSPSHPPVFVTRAPDAIVAWLRSDVDEGCTPASWRLSDGRLTLLDSEIKCDAPGPLVGMPDGTIVAACPRGGTVEVRRFRAGSPSIALARLPHAGCDMLAADGEEHVRAVCAGDPPRAYRINIVSGLHAEVELDSPGADQALVAGVELDRAGRRIVRLVGGERVVLAEDVDAACASPDGTALVATGPDGLSVLDTVGGVHRRLWGAEAGGGTPMLVSWSPDGTRIAHGYRDGDGGTVRLATLGSEEVVVRLRVPDATAVRPGTRIWVAERFEVDVSGRVTEPVWSTLKALLRVREVVRADTGVICTALSEGEEGGVVERLTGSNDPPPGSESDSRLAIGTGAEPPAAWMYSFSARPRENLAGWVQGTHVTGALLSITVTRKRLAPLKR